VRWLILLACLVPAGAAPISSCFLNDPLDQQQGITCNIHRSPDIVPMPIITVAGFIGILDDTLLTDVLSFVDRGDGLSVSLQLLSIGCNCFPNAGQIAAFIPRSPVDPTVFQAPAIVGTNTFNVYTQDTPEPSTALLVLASLVLFFFRRTGRSAVR
jgi:hypothetical protein